MALKTAPNKSKMDCNVIYRFFPTMVKGCQECYVVFFPYLGFHESFQCQSMFQLFSSTNVVVVVTFI